MVSCLIVDDEPVARRILRNYCGQLPYLNVVAECGNALEARDILLRQAVDLLFLDIHLPAMSGIGLLHTIKNQPQVIFTTAYQEYAVQAFDLAACDYLVKPFSLERFVVAVDKARGNLAPAGKDRREPGATTQSEVLVVKGGGKLYFVPYWDCLYGEAQGNYTKVVTVRETILTKLALSAFIDALPRETFIRIHRSFVVNKAHIGYIEGNRAFVRGNPIPIAPGNREDLLRHWR